MKNSLLNTGAQAPAVSRRRFVQGLMLGGAAAWLGAQTGSAWAGPAAARSRLGDGQPALLSGTEVALEIGRTGVNFTGRSRLATTINGTLPGPTLRWREGSSVTVRVTNRLPVTTSLHWHGIVLPAAMDGVPGISFAGIAPGATFEYRFPVRQSGTYWYHGHSGLQEQTGLYGALVIDPAGADPIRADRDHVVMLNDWSDEDPHAIADHLKKQGDYYNQHQPTVGEFLDAVGHDGLRQALAERKMWARMRMSRRDLVDVTGATYTYLMNGRTPAGNWTGLFEVGELVRLRLINGSANSYFDVRIPGLELVVVAADGQPVAPVAVEELRIATAETFDVLVRPTAARAYTIFAQSMSRDGYARGTLAPREGLTAALPALDAVPELAMIDMMGAGAHGDGHGHGHGHGKSMDMEMDMDHVAARAGGVGGKLTPAGPRPARHARTEPDNPAVDMQVDAPRTNLDDPGVGLRGNGRRVLTYADLHTLDGPLFPHVPVTREIELHLTGNMRRFVWGFDGLTYAEAAPVHFPHGEQLRVILCNDTMMTHPIHLHGMWCELETPQGQFLVRKHTISVQPAQRVTFRVMANAPGRWAWHCHLLYHMEAGMFREVVVA